jgi:hypothetical protein
MLAWLRSKMPTYSKLDEEDDDTLPPLENNNRPICESGLKIIGYDGKRWSSSAMMIMGIFVGIFVAFLAGGLAAWFFRHPVNDSSQRVCIDRDLKYTCGNSTEQALELGCHFDLLSVSFVPWQCVDWELEKEFLAEGPWRYWADRHKKVELAQDELWSRPAMPNDSFHVTMHWHRMHCLYQWRKMHRAFESGRRMDSSYSAYGHTVHCGEVFADTRPGDAIGGTVSIHFDTC